MNCKNGKCGRCPGCMKKISKVMPDNYGRHGLTEYELAELQKRERDEMRKGLMRPKDNDGDGYYVAYPGAPDNTPVPKASVKPGQQRRRQTGRHQQPPQQRRSAVPPRRIEEDEIPEKSPFGAKLTSFSGKNGGVAVYSDGSTYSVRGWSRPVRGNKIR